MCWSGCRFLQKGLLEGGMKLYGEHCVEGITRLGVPLIFLVVNFHYPSARSYHMGFLDIFNGRTSLITLSDWFGVKLVISNS